MSAPGAEGRIAGCTGVLLAGGRGRRLGGLPKGLLTVDGEPLVARALRLFAALFEDALLLADDARPYAAFEVRAAADLLPGRGAPGGLHAALAAIATPWAFVLGCDMPCPSADGVRLLAARRTPACGAVCATWDGALQPLHALWSREAFPAVDAALRTATPSLRSLARAVNAVEVTAEDWARVDPGGLAFGNANTPADLARLGLEHPGRAPLARARPPGEGSSA